MNKIRNVLIGTALCLATVAFGAQVILYGDPDTSNSPKPTTIGRKAFEAGFTASTNATRQLNAASVTVSKGAASTLTVSTRTISVLDSTTNAVSLVLVTNVAITSVAPVTNAVFTLP